MMDWIIPIVIGWFLRGFIGGDQAKELKSNLLDAETVPTPTPKVPSVESALSQLDGIEERIRRDGHEIPMSGLNSVRAALTDKPLPGPGRPINL